MAGEKPQFVVVLTKLCGSIISRGYISWLLVVHGEKSGVYKAKKVDIFKPALLCRDYHFLRPPIQDSLLKLQEKFNKNGEI